MEKSRIINELKSLNQRMNSIENHLENLQNFYNDVKKLVRRKGKTDFIKRQELEELIVKYGGD